MKVYEATERTSKSKDKPVPKNCVCGAVPVDVKARGLGICYFCNECLLCGLWKKNRDTAIESWNTEIQQVRYSRSERGVDNE